jgi:hypothetical protein
MLRSLLLALLLTALGNQGALVADTIETLHLRHRPAEEMIPILRPLLAEDDALTGQGFQLFVRAPAHRIAALREALAQLDVEARMLRISVSRAGSVDEAESGLRARARIGPDSAQANVRITSSQRRSDSGDTQSVLVREGTHAWIATGSIELAIQPLITLDQGGYSVQHQLGERTLESGFEVLARLAGDRVLVEIHRQREAPSRRQGGAIETDTLATTVSGRLGEWMELGGVGEFEEGQGSGAGYSYGTARREQRIYLMVEYYSEK